MLVVLVVLAVAAGWLVRSLMRVEVTVAPVVRGVAVATVPGSVVVKAEQVAEVASEVGGRVRESWMEVGRRYAEGEPLLQLDTGDLDLAIARTESDLEAARARAKLGSTAQTELANARDNLAEIERLAGMGHRSETDVVQARRTVEQIEQRIALEQVAADQLIRGLENTLAAQQRERGKMTLRAPFEGIIAAGYARAGDLIGVGTPVAQLISVSRLVEARVAEENFASLAVGQDASVRFLGLGGELHRARVRQLLPTADAATQRYVVHLTVELPPEKLVPGSTGEVSILVGRREDALIVPRLAVMEGRVMRVRGGRVEPVPVRTGFTGLNEVEILDGLAEGDRVVVDPLDAVRPGDRVEVVEEVKTEQ